jgi:uncharacterized Zn finger protein
MARESAAVKARRLLVEGRVTITRVDGARIVSLVRGDSAAVYVVVHYPRWGWSCTCPALGRACSHVLAVQLVVVVDRVEPPPDGAAVPLPREAVPA